MARIAWRNLADSATLLSGASWTGSMPLSEVQKPRLQGRARSLTNDAPIDLDFGAPVTLDCVALMGVSPLYDGYAMYVMGSNVEAGGIDVFGTATSVMLAAGSRIPPNVFWYGASRTCRYLRVLLTQGGSPIIPDYWDVRRLWVSPSMEIEAGADWGIGTNDASEQTVSDEQVVFSAERRRARYLDWSIVSATGQQAYGYETPTLDCLAEMDMACGDVGEVIVAPRMSVPGADARRVIGMNTVYGQLRNRSGIKRAGDIDYSYSARVQELPSNY